jgi:peptide/nickel transport system ATP-binding protein
MENETILKIEGMKKFFPIGKGIFRRPTGYVRAVDNIDIEIKMGETLGLVGESGCGKSTVGNCIARLIDIDEGKILFNRDMSKESLVVSRLSQKELREAGFRRDVQIVFQDPFSSLNPRMCVASIIKEPITCNKMISNKKELKNRLLELLDQVGLQPEYLERFPHSFSGGQRQRICIARALSVNPRLLICDEAVSALDVSIQAQILMLLKDLQRRLNIAFLFISHDFAVIRYISHNVAVMYVGKIVELSETEEIFNNPAHPYTEALLSSVYEIDFRQKKERIVLRGEVANPAHPPSGCYFHPRCQYAQPICSQEAPPWIKINKRHWAACHFAGQLVLRGIRDEAKPEAVNQMEENQDA